MCVTFSFHVAIEAMKNAHKEEMEKTHRSQLTGLNSDIDELRLQYEYVAFYLCNYLFIYLFICLIVLTQTQIINKDGTWMAFHSIDYWLCQWFFWIGNWEKNKQSNVVYVLPCKIPMFSADVCCEFGLMLQLCNCLGRSCSPSRGSWRFCRSSTLRSAWRTLTWPRPWRRRGRPWGSVSGRTRSLMLTTRSACTHTHTQTQTRMTVLAVTLLLFPSNRSWITGWLWRSLGCAPVSAGKRRCRHSRRAKMFMNWRYTNKAAHIDTHEHVLTHARNNKSFLWNPSASQVLLRIKESEIQYLKQEIHSLKDELQSALRVNRKEGGGGVTCTPSPLVVYSSCRSYCSPFRTRNMPPTNIRTSTRSSASWRPRPTATSASWRRSCSWPQRLWARGAWTDPSRLDTVTTVCFCNGRVQSDVFKGPTSTLL